MKKILLPLLGILLLAGCEKEAATPVTTGDSTLDLRATAKLIVCHNTGSETIPYEMIEIGEPAYEKAHLEHGDARPGEAIPEMPGYRFGCNCEVEPEETACLPDGKTWTTENLSLAPAGYSEGADFWWYDDNEATYGKYGRLYTWDAAKKACQELGDGWRLPTKNDWDGLIRAYDATWPGSGSAFSVPALTSLLGNNSPSGFDARLGGGRFIYYPNGPEFDYLGQYGYYWSSTAHTSAGYYISYYFDDVEYHEVSRGYNQGAFGFSCRCVKD